MLQRDRRAVAASPRRRGRRRTARRSPGRTPRRRARCPRRPRRSTRRSRRGRRGSSSCRRSGRRASGRRTCRRCRCPPRRRSRRRVAASRIRSTISRSDGAVELGDDVGAESTWSSRSSRASGPPDQRPASRASSTGERAARRRQVDAVAATSVVGGASRGRSISRHSPRARSTSTATMLIPIGGDDRAEQRAEAEWRRRSRRRTGGRRACSRSARRRSRRRGSRRTRATRAAGDGSAESGRLGVSAHGTPVVLATRRPS